MIRPSDAVLDELTRRLAAATKITFDAAWDMVTMALEHGLIAADLDAGDLAAALAFLVFFDPANPCTMRDVERYGWFDAVPLPRAVRDVVVDRAGLWVVAAPAGNGATTTGHVLAALMATRPGPSVTIRERPRSRDDLRAVVAAAGAQRVIVTFAAQRFEAALRELVEAAGPETVAAVIRGATSQILIPTIRHGRLAWCEVAVGDDGWRDAIAAGVWGEPLVAAAGAGSLRFEHHLAELITAGIVSARFAGMDWGPQHAATFDARMELLGAPAAVDVRRIACAAFDRLSRRGPVTSDRLREATIADVRARVTGHLHDELFELDDDTQRVFLTQRLERPGLTMVLENLDLIVFLSPGQHRLTSPRRCADGRFVRDH